jgi:hypothetical protein
MLGGSILTFYLFNKTKPKKILIKKITDIDTLNSSSDKEYITVHNIPDFILRSAQSYIFLGEHNLENHNHFNSVKNIHSSLMCRNITLVIFTYLSIGVFMNRDMIEKCHYLKALLSGNWSEKSLVWDISEQQLKPMENVKECNMGAKVIECNHECTLIHKTAYPYTTTIQFSDDNETLVFYTSY